MQIVEHDHAHGPAQPAEGALVELGPDLRTRAPDEEPHGFARVAEREEEEPRAAVLARGRSADHRALPVIDLALVAGRRGDDGVRLDHGGAAELPHEAAHARVPAGEAVVVDEVLRNRHRVPPATQGLDDELAIRLAGAGARRTARRSLRVGGGVGGHLRRGGRIWRPHFRWVWWRPHLGPAPGAVHGDPGRLQVRARRLAADVRGFFDAPERPAGSPQREDLLLCVFPQDVDHDRRRTRRPSPVSTSRLATRGGRVSGVDQWPDSGVHRGQPWFFLSSRLGNRPLQLRILLGFGDRCLVSSSRWGMSRLPALPSCGPRSPLSECRVN